MDKLRAAFTSLVAGIAVTLLKIVAWSQSFSVAVLADAVHSAVDLLAVTITYLAVKASLKPPDLLRASVVELLDYAPPDIVERTKAKAGSVAGVQSVRAVKVRKSGSVYHADVTITVDENLTVKEAHEIADKVEKTLREVLGGEVTVHVEPHKPTAKPVEKTPPSSASRSPPEPSEPPSRSPQ